MMFSVVTPSFNCMPYLPACCASVADQREEGVSVEHMVLDGASQDGTVAWLRAEKPRFGFTWISEPDTGMYDALNKGFDCASGEYLAWLNGDEQYLPGVLQQVATAFEQHPSCDILCGDALVVDEANQLLCIRRGEPLRAAYIVNEGMHTLTCSIFFRRRLWEHGLRFDASLKSVGENDFFLKALMAGFRAKYLRMMMAAFTHTGSNLGASGLAKNELDAFRKAHCRWYLRLFVTERLLTVVRRLEKLCRGAYRMPMSLPYALYREGQLDIRSSYACSNPTYKWPKAIE